MGLPPLAWLFSKSWIFQGVASVAIGFVALSWVAGRAGLPGAAVVHVTEANVEVDIAGYSFRIGERRYEPIVCELPAGDHELILTRDGHVLYRETFAVEAGNSVVLTAYDPERLRREASCR